MKGNKRIQVKRWWIALCVLALFGNNTCAALDAVQAGDISDAGQVQEQSQMQDASSEQSFEKEQGPNLSQPNPEPEKPEQSPGLGGVVTPEPAPETPNSSSYTVTLDSCTIGAGETREYTTVSPQFAGASLPEGYYAGDLTVEITGTVTIASGGCLSIGTLSIGSDAEASPVIRGTLSNTGLIVVKAGGCLKLTCAEIDLSGTGVLIVQEPGALVELTATTIDDSLVAWATPTVNNRNDQPDEVWLQNGVPLTADALPKTLRSNLQYLGSEERMNIEVVWDLSGYDGRTSGTLQLNGTFVDEDGQEIPSVVPLTITVNWYEPEQIVVTDTQWRGATACSAALTVRSLPENGAVWGEVSRDGLTWQRWSEFDVLVDDYGIITCIFYETDLTPSYYRVVAQDTQTMRLMVSEAFLMPEEEGEDQGGNRGGSTAFHPPARHPTAVTDAQDSEESEEEETETLADLSAWKELLGWDGLLSAVRVPDRANPMPSAPEDNSADTETPVQITSMVAIPKKEEDLSEQSIAGLIWEQMIQTAEVQDTDDSAQTQTMTAVPKSDLPQAEVEPQSEEVQSVIAQPEEIAEEQVIEQQEASGLSDPLQVVLIVVGLVVCVAIGITVAGFGPLRKKK